ncbi:MAG: hypothetical protein ACI9KE_004154 [Polyangiales bacterium]|jgi:hypothetical protein
MPSIASIFLLMAFVFSARVAVVFFLAPVTDAFFAVKFQDPLTTLRASTTLNP